MSSRINQKLTETFLSAAGAPHFPLRDYRHGPLLFDQYDGVGATGLNQMIGSKAFVAFMTPSMFLKLASPGVVHDSLDYIMQGIRTYEDTDKFPLASPYLMVNFKTDPAKIIAHEGRNRMRAIRRLGVKGDIPVVIFVNDKNLKEIDAPTIRRFFNGAVNEIGAPVRGPLFSRALVGNHEFTAKPF